MESAQIEIMNQIREWFTYDAVAGILMRRRKTRSDAHDRIGYRHTIFFMGTYYPYTTLIWILYYGQFPNKWIDHINRIKNDNRIENLRLVTPTQNQQNKAGTGMYPKGVTWRNRIRKPWQAKIRVNGIRLHLGSFASMEEAAEAYIKACLKYHGEFACPK